MIMKREDHAIEIAKALLSCPKYMELYHDDMIDDCVNFNGSAITEIARDAVDLVDAIYKTINERH